MLKSNIILKEVSAMDMKDFIEQNRKEVIDRYGSLAEAHAHFKPDAGTYAMQNGENVICMDLQEFIPQYASNPLPVYSDRRYELHLNGWFESHRETDYCVSLQFNKETWQQMVDEIRLAPWTLKFHFDVNPEQQTAGHGEKFYVCDVNRVEGVGYRSNNYFTVIWYEGMQQRQLDNVKFAQMFEDIQTKFDQVAS